MNQRAILSNEASILKPNYRLALSLTVCSILLLAIFVLGVGNAGADSEIWVTKEQAEQTIPQLNLPSFAPAIDVLGKSVVNIRTKGTVKSGGSGSFHGGNPLDFLLQQRSRRQREQPFRSLGSGFVIHPDGYIVTNNHVVEKASKIQISFRDDKKTYIAKLVGSDPNTDLALLKVDHPKKLPAAPLGDSDQLLPGDWVLAIGNPFHLGHTATLGIVSAKSRKLNVPGQESRPYDSFIQTDASINPGNSGGPLFNVNGEVVGVNTAIFSPGAQGPSGFNIGIGFAIPINMVKRIINQLKDNGKVIRGWLGVLIQPVDNDLAEAMGLKEARGALVADVVDDSPADKSGFLTGDVILSFDGKRVEENQDLPWIVANTEIGKKVSVGIIRERKKQVIRVTVEQLKDGGVKVDTEEEEEEVEYQFGLSVQELSPEIARSLGLDVETGVIVADVMPGSPAAEAGLKRGDLISKLGAKKIKSSRQLRALLKKADDDSPILLLIQRRGNTVFLTLKKE